VKLRRALNGKVAREPPGSLKNSDRDPVELEPARCDTERVADERQPGEDERRRSVAPRALELRERLLRADEAADQVGRHASERVAERRDRECGPQQVAVHLQHREERSLGADGNERRRDECRREQRREARVGRE
jgi:hypothetical protein